MSIVCFGDSNTYGYDPRSFFGGRYDADCRWVDILRGLSGRDIKNDGMNGREIPRNGAGVPRDAELLIIMLGTNDLLQGKSAEETTACMERFLNGLQIEGDRLLLIAPPPMALGEWVSDQGLISESRRLGQCYGPLAERMGIGFVDASVWDIPMAYDGVHFTEEGQRRFAHCLYDTLKGRYIDADCRNEST